MRVLQIHNSYRETGGEDTVVAREADLLRSAGHEVVEYRASNPHAALPTAASLAVSPWNPASALRLRRVAQTVEPDVAHVHNTWWALSPSILNALQALDVPIVVTLHNYRLMCVNAQLFRSGAPCEDCVATHPWRGVRHRCYRDSLTASAISAATLQLNRWMSTWEAVDRFLALTQFARLRHIEAGLPPDRIFVKPNFVDDPGNRLANPSDSVSVLYVGRLSPEKGVHLLLDAWRKSRVSGLELVVVGDGPMRQILQARETPNVRFAGHLNQNRVKRLMLESRALLFPSIWYEGQPMVLLEALACGLPVVASDIGGLPETLADQSARILAEPGNAESWLDALEQLKDRGWVDRAGASARSTYLERYDYRAGLSGLMGAYAGAIADRGRRSQGRD